MNFLHLFIFNSKKRQRISWTYRNHHSVLPSVNVIHYLPFPKITHWYRRLCFIIMVKNCSIPTLNVRLALRIPVFSLPVTLRHCARSISPLNFHAYFKNLIKNKKKKKN